MAPAHPYQALTKDSVLRVPNYQFHIDSECNVITTAGEPLKPFSHQSATSYTSRFIPTQLVETYCIAIEQSIGDASTVTDQLSVHNIADAMPADEQFGAVTGDNTGCDASAVNYRNRSDGPDGALNSSLLSEMNHHTVGSSRYSPTLVSGSIQQVFDNLSAFGFNPNDPTIQAFMGGVIAALNSLHVTNNTDCKNGTIYADVTPAQSPAKVCATLEYKAFYAFGSEFTPFYFPKGYAIPVGGGDLSLANWHIVDNYRAEVQTLIDNTLPPNNGCGGSPGPRVPAYSTKYHVDKNILDLFNFVKNFLLTLQNVLPAPLKPVIDVILGPGDSTLKQKFNTFVGSHDHTPKNYTTLHGTWAGTADCNTEEYRIAEGEVISYGRPTHLSAPGVINMALFHQHDHGVRGILRKEEDGAAFILANFVPENSKDYKAPHDSVEEFGDYGAPNGGYPFHNHNGGPDSLPVGSDFQPAHLPVGGMKNHGVYRPGKFGPVLGDPSTYTLRTVQKFNNPHDKMIDNMGITMIFWSTDETIPENEDQKFFFINPSASLSGFQPPNHV